MPPTIDGRTAIGWDLGGVHVKAARIVDARVVEAVQAPCRLWRGIEALDETFAGLPEWAGAPAAHFVTMTGELTDCFADRQEGVATLSAWAEARLQGPVRIYGGRADFLDPSESAAHAADIASANWFASAAWVGRHHADALMIDIGSTTTDLIPVVGGLPAARGYSDAERLETGELVYTGIVRTPLATLAAWAPWRGRRQRLMTETFATSADIYRLTDDLPDGADQQASPDLKGKSLAESQTRLARMIGRDRAEGTPDAWCALAAFFVEVQTRLIGDAAATLLSRPDLASDAPIVLCGAGAFLGERVAQRLGRATRYLTEIVPADGTPEHARWISTCGPAVAVGLLGANRAG